MPLTCEICRITSSLPCFELGVEYLTSQLVQVWVLDATPGKVRSGGDGEDHPGELIATLRQMPSSVIHPSSND